MKKLFAFLIALLSLANVASAQSVSTFSPFKLSSTVISPTNASWTLKLPYLGGSGTKCVQVDNNGLFAVATAACGTGSGGSSTGNVATSTNETAGQLAVWTSNSATPATLGKVATTTLTASSPLTLSQPIVVLGPSASVLTLSTSGTWSGNAVTATALAANGTNCSSGSYPLGVDASGNSETCTAVPSFFSYPWTPVSHWSQTTAGTSTALWLQATPFSLFASSTAAFDSATTTNLEAKSNFWLSGLSQGILFVGSAGKVSTAATSTFSLSQFTNDLANLTATNGTLTFSGNYNGSAARTVGLNLGNANTWTILQTFNYSSSTLYSSFVTASTTNLIVNGQSINNLAGTGLAISGNALTSTLGTSVDLTSEVTGTLPVGNGGTGQVTFTSGRLLYGAGTAGIQTVATTSETCTSPLSCTAHDVLTGGGAITLGTVTVAKGGTNATAFPANTLISSDGAGTTLGATSTAPLYVGSLTATSSIQNSLFLNNMIGIGTSTPQYLGSFASSTAPQLALSAGAGITQWTFRNAGGNFYLASTTLAGIATSTTALFSIETALGMSTTTIANSDFRIKTGSPNAFSILDNYGTQDLLVNTSSTTSSLFTVAATTSPSLLNPIKLFDVDQYGHLTASSTRATPTISCTPSGGTIGANSNDVTGDFTTGTLSTACTLTFANAYATTPEVMVGGGLTSGLTRSTTAVTFTLSAAVTGDNISYFVIMP